MIHPIRRVRRVLSDVFGAGYNGANQGRANFIFSVLLILFFGVVVAAGVGLIYLLDPVLTWVFATSTRFCSVVAIILVIALGWAFARYELPNEDEN